VPWDLYYYKKRLFEKHKNENTLLDHKFKIHCAEEVF
jgi:hypothetical protein